MTPTLLAASSAAYLASPATGSDSSAASVDGSSLSGTASDESPDDHRDDVAPSDFAVLLAAMMAPSAPSALRPRIEPTDAANPSAQASAVGDAVAATPAGLANLVPPPPPAVGISGSNPIASEIDTPPTAPASTVAASGTASSATIDRLDDTRAMAGADPTVARTATTPTEGADASRVDALTETVRASSMTGRETSVPSFGPVALDRPMSLGRGITQRTVQLSDASLADSPQKAENEPSVAVSLSVTDVDGQPTAALSSPVDERSAQEVPPIRPAPAASPTAESMGVLSDGGATAAMAVAVGVPRSGTADALDAMSAEDAATPLAVETDASAFAAPPEAPQGSVAARTVTGSEVTELPAQVPASAETTRVVREDPSAAKDDAAAPSAVGVPAGPGHVAITDRPGSAEAPTLPVVAGVRPGDTSQHIVRAAQRAQAADGTQHMRLEMHPGDLGAVAVEVTIEDGAVHVAMVAERGETKDLLRSSIGELRSSLVAAGFSAGRVDIQSGLSDGRFGQAADRNDAWSQSFDRPDSRRDQSGAFANMFEQSSGRGDQSRSPRSFAELADRRDLVPALRAVRGSDRLSPDPATTPKGPPRDRLDVQL